MNGEEQRTHKKALNKLQEDVVASIEATLVEVDERLKEETQTFDRRLKEEAQAHTEDVEHLQAQIKINRELVNSISSEMHYRKQLHRKLLGRLRWLITGR